MVTNDGVLIYDPSLTIQINKIEIVQKSKYYFDYQLKHIGDENNGYFLLCTLNYLYIFSSIGEFLQKYKISLNMNTINFYSIIPYNYFDNNNYFFYSYTPLNKKNNFFQKYNYDSLLNNITFISEQKILSVVEAHDNVSCHYINYNNNDNMICLLLSIAIVGNSKTYYIKIFNPQNNFEKIKEIEIKCDSKNIIDLKSVIDQKTMNKRCL